MIHGKDNCQRIVRTIPGQGTGTDGDVYQTADGRTWRRIQPWEADGTVTGVGTIGYLHNGHICNHK